MNTFFYKGVLLYLAFSLTFLCSISESEAISPVLHPSPQPRPGPYIQELLPDGKTTEITTMPFFGLPTTPPGPPFLDLEGYPYFEKKDPFSLETSFEGGVPQYLTLPSNLLPNEEQNMIDSCGLEIPNTLPSSSTNPYNLHDGAPVITQIDGTSPSDDIKRLLDKMKVDLGGGGSVDLNDVTTIIDIMEGNAITGRNYSGMPLLHYNGPNKFKSVTPILDGNNNVIGGNVDIHQVWYDSHIESDTSLLDASAVAGVPWTITYTVDVLSRGHDDFAPMVMYFDNPDCMPPGLPNVAMDQTFFPMEEGTRTVFKIKMAPAKFFNLSYHWGWRVHPPRVQVTENANKVIEGDTLVEWEEKVFGTNPQADEPSKLAAIAKIGDLSPAKRIWIAMKQLQITPADSALVDESMEAFLQWIDRTALPEGVTEDPNSDVTLFYVNNTIYGKVKGIEDDSVMVVDGWRERPFTLKVKLYNGDYFEHAYMNVDFGGARGWENQFHSTIPSGGAGPWFTFGRHHWWPNAGAPGWPVINQTRPLITVGPANPAIPNDITEHNIILNLHYEPSRRLRLYQFDPLHHDVAIWSIH